MWSTGFEFQVEISCDMSVHQRVMLFGTVLDPDEIFLEILSHGNVSFPTEKADYVQRPSVDVFRQVFLVLDPKQRAKEYPVVGIAG